MDWKQRFLWLQQFDRYHHPQQRYKHWSIRFHGMQWFDYSNDVQ